MLQKTTLMLANDGPHTYEEIWQQQKNSFCLLINYNRLQFFTCWRSRSRMRAILYFEVLVVGMLPIIFLYFWLIIERAGSPLNTNNYNFLDAINWYKQLIIFMLHVINCSYFSLIILFILYSLYYFTCNDNFNFFSLPQFFFPKLLKSSLNNPNPVRETKSSRIYRYVG